MFEGNFLNIPGRDGWESWLAVDEIAAAAGDISMVDDWALEDQRKTLPIVWKKEVDEVGTEAGLREFARSLSTAALSR